MQQVSNEILIRQAKDAQKEAIKKRMIVGEQCLPIFTSSFCFFNADDVDVLLSNNQKRVRLRELADTLEEKKDRAKSPIQFRFKDKNLILSLCAEIERDFKAKQTAISDFW